MRFQRCLSIKKRINNQSDREYSVSACLCCDCIFQDAYNHVKKCRENMQPIRGFIEQLSRWEEKLFGSIVTDISEPDY